MNNKKQIKTTNKKNRIRRSLYPGLWFIAAADESLLQQCPIPEQDKQAGVGMAILCTTVAAGISCYYAIHSLFGSWDVSLPIALFWAIIIFNLDRFMVGSLRKDKRKRWWNELKVAFPRMVLAFLIAILISKPLEVKFFQNQIGAEKTRFNKGEVAASTTYSNSLVEKKRNELDAQKEELSKLKTQNSDVNREPEYIVAANEYNQCITQQTQKENELASKRQLYQQHYNNRQGYISEKSGLEENIRQQKENGNDGITDIRQRIEVLKRNIQAESGEMKLASEDIKNISTEIRDLGCPARKLAKEEVAQKLLLNYDKRNNKAQQAIDSLNAVVIQQEKELKALTDTSQHNYDIASSDIMGQLRILNNLKKRDPSMLLAGWLITALFFLLELAPILVKIISPRGEYDTLIAIAEQQAFDREEAAEEESRQEKNARKQAAINNVRQVYDLDDQVKTRVQEKILNAQADLAEKIVSAWKENEENELNADTSGYLKSKIMQS